MSHVILLHHVREERGTHFALLVIDRKLRGIHQSHSQEAVPMAVLTVAVL